MPLLAAPTCTYAYVYRYYSQRRGFCASQGAKKRGEGGSRSKKWRNEARQKMWERQKRIGVIVPQFLACHCLQLLAGFYTTERERGRISTRCEDTLVHDMYIWYEVFLRLHNDIAVLPHSIPCWAGLSANKEFHDRQRQARINTRVSTYSSFRAL